jgi:uncharacterized protein YkwD
MQSLDDRILVVLNQARGARGLRPLTPSAPLDAAAAAHSQDMLRHGFFAHDSFGGGNLEQRLDRYYPSTGFLTWTVGETLLWVSPYVDARTTVTDWLGSPEHRQILLGSTWRELGIAALHVGDAGGVFGGHEVTVVTADFGARAR